jgi:acetylornithine/succinyldiaminopimelate/putrescine aminotransferase
MKYKIYFENAAGEERESVIVANSDADACDEALKIIRNLQDSTIAFQLRNEQGEVISF